MKKLQALMMAVGMVVGTANLVLASDKKDDHKEEKKGDHKDDHGKDKKKH
ncbi:MAG: hypothetical protein SFV51_10415 [Bryobacteraceae bacterium]|nr:hypothetical protein [Bryobacteraceae bacterium]